MTIFVLDVHTRQASPEAAKNYQQVTAQPGPPTLVELANEAGFTACKSIEENGVTKESCVRPTDYNDKKVYEGITIKCPASGLCTVTRKAKKK